jgi:uroporphyrinogen decarboxylase
VTAVDPKTRVLAALEHREPDRIPWGEHSIDYNVYEDILGRGTLVQAKFKQTQAYWDGRRDEVVESYKRDRVDLIRALDMDIAFVSRVPPKDYSPEPMEKIDEGVYRDAAGSIFHVSATTHDLRIFERNTSDYVPPTVESLQKQIDEFDPDAVGDPEDSCWEFVHHVVEELGATHFVMLMCGDLEWPRFGATEEESWMNLVTQPDVCAKIAELSRMQLCREVELYAKLGVDGIMPCGDLVSSTGLMASPDIYRELVYPVHKAHVEAAHAKGLKVLKHSCGHVWPVIDELAEVYDAYEGIQGTAGMDIGKLKERVAGKLCLWGGIWHEHIILGGVDDIRADASYAFSTAAPAGGYIMGSSHSLAVDAKPENILEMKGCRDEWGVYPIDPARFA